MNKKVKWLLLFLMGSMTLGFMVSSQAKEPDDSISVLRVQIIQLDQRLAILEQAIAQVSGYVSKSTQENRAIAQEIHSDVKIAVSEFNSGYDSLNKRMLTLENSQKQLLVEYSNLEVRFSELENEIQRLSVEQNRLANSSTNRNKSILAQAQQSRQMKSDFSPAIKSGVRSQPSSNASIVRSYIKSYGLERIMRTPNYKPVSTERSRRSFSQLRIPRRGCYSEVVIEGDPYKDSQYRGRSIGRSSRPAIEVVPYSQERGDFYTKIDTGVIAQWFDRLIP